MNGLVLQLWVFMVAGWINRSQQNVIEYLLEENRVWYQNSIDANQAASRW